jgi:hypothetical protein
MRFRECAISFSKAPKAKVYAKGVSFIDGEVSEGIVCLDEH